MSRARADSAARRFRIGVTELLADPGPSLLALPGPGASGRLALGQLLHARYQARAAEADPTFQAEVPLGHALDQDGWRVELSGRADAVRVLPSGELRVEELKSTAGASPAAALRESAREQAAVYAWMLARREQRPVSAALVWLATDDETPPRCESVEVDLDAVEDRVRSRLAPRLREAGREHAERAARRSAAERVRLPYPRPRPGQEPIGESVERALAEGESLLLEAPTGLGKTAAVLVPALRFALASGRQVFFLTSRTTQQAGVLATHAALGLGDAAPAVRVGARAALCANNVVVCHEDACRFARNHHRKLEAGDLVTRVLCLAPEALFEAARTAEVCPHALARTAARRAALVVGDLNHALDSGATLEAFASPGGPRDAVLILDEAHHVVERARELAGARLETSVLEAAIDAAALGGAPVHRALEEPLRAWIAWLEEAAWDAAGGTESGDLAAELAVDGDAVEALAARLEGAYAAYLDYRLETRSLEAEDPVTRAWLAARGFARRLAEARESEADERFATLIERDDAGVRARVLCLDPGPQLAALYARCHAVIALSATLSPSEFHRETLGLPAARTGTLCVPSPFPAENRRVVIDPGVGTRRGERRAEAPRIAARLAALATAVPGHCLALLPSFAFLEAIAAHLGGARVPLRVQPRHSDRSEREAWIAALRHPAAPGLFLAVAGGVFAEGVDYAGGALCAVAVVGPCLPPPDPERLLLQRHYEARFERGFEYAFALPGMTRVVQAAGRLIRGPDERGVVALYGRRFLASPYRDALPEAWLGGAGPEACVGDPAQVAAQFFADAEHARISRAPGPHTADPAPPG